MFTNVWTEAVSKNVSQCVFFFNLRMGNTGICWADYNYMFLVVIIFLCYLIEILIYTVNFSKVQRLAAIKLVCRMSRKIWLSFFLFTVIFLDCLLSKKWLFWLMQEHSKKTAYFVKILGFAVWSSWFQLSVLPPAFTT